MYLSIFGKFLLITRILKEQTLLEKQRWKHVKNEHKHIFYNFPVTDAKIEFFSNIILEFVVNS